MFGLEDCPSGQGRVTYAAAPGEKPVLSGGVPVEGWKLLETPPASLPAAARGKVWVAAMPQGFDTVRALSDDSGLLTRAMSRPIKPDPSRAPVARGRDRVTPEQKTRLPILPGQVKDWSYVGQMVLRLLPGHECCNLLPAARYEEESSTLVTTIPAARYIYPLELKRRLPGSPEEVSISIHLENAPEFLDEPGEWCADAVQRLIYLWPRDGQSPQKIVAGRLSELIRVEGRVLDDAPADVPARGLTFRGLTFTETAASDSPPDHLDWELQNGWEQFDRPTHALRFRSASDCAVVACEFVKLGGGAVRVDLHSQNNVIRDCWMHQLGGGGVLLAGYGLGTKDVNFGHQVVNNLIEDVGLIWWDKMGIFVWQSGRSEIRHNHVRRTAYTGIALGGPSPWELKPHIQPDGNKTFRWKEIEKVVAAHKDDPEFAAIPGRLAALGRKMWETALPGGPTLLMAVWYNQEMLHTKDVLVQHNIVEESSLRCADANNIYVGGGSGRGIRVLENWVDSSNCESIRCDDDVRKAVVARNIIGPSGNMMSNKGDNEFSENIRIAKGPVILMRLKPDHPNSIFGTIVAKDAVIARNTLFQTSGALAAAPITLSRLEAGVGYYAGMKLANNLYWAPGDNAQTRTWLADMQAKGFEQGSIIADPLFVDAGNGDYRVREDSPALKLGITGVDARNWGVTKENPFWSGSAGTKGKNK